MAVLAPPASVASIRDGSGMEAHAAEGRRWDRWWEALGQRRRPLHHPERYRNLIMPVWGWSGYFCELAPEYQNHIIQRQMHRVG
jgi:hypothetical protein